MDFDHYIALPVYKFARPKRCASWLATRAQDNMVCFVLFFSLSFPCNWRAPAFFQLPSLFCYFILFSFFSGWVPAGPLRPSRTYQLGTNQKLWFPTLFRTYLEFCKSDSMYSGKFVPTEAWGLTLALNHKRTLSEWSLSQWPVTMKKFPKKKETSKKKKKKVKE